MEHHSFWRTAAYNLLHYLAAALPGLLPKVSQLVFFLTLDLFWTNIKEYGQLQKKCIYQCLHIRSAIFHFVLFPDWSMEFSFHLVLLRMILLRKKKYSCGRNTQWDNFSLPSWLGVFDWYWYCSQRERADDASWTARWTVRYLCTAVVIKVSSKLQMFIIIVVLKCINLTEFVRWTCLWFQSPSCPVLWCQLLKYWFIVKTRNCICRSTEQRQMLE